MISELYRQTTQHKTTLCCTDASQAKRRQSTGLQERKYSRNDPKRRANWKADDQEYAVA